MAEETIWPRFDRRRGETGDGGVLDGLRSGRESPVESLGVFELLHDLLALFHDADDGVAGLPAAGWSIIAKTFSSGQFYTDSTRLRASNCPTSGAWPGIPADNTGRGLATGAFVSTKNNDR